MRQFHAMHADACGCISKPLRVLVEGGDSALISLNMADTVSSGASMGFCGLIRPHHRANQEPDNKTLDK